MNLWERFKMHDSVFFQCHGVGKKVQNMRLEKPKTYYKQKLQPWI